MFRTVFALLILAVSAFAQTAPDPSKIPSVTLPAGIVATVNYDQLGSPRITGGFGAIYPVVGSVGIYGVSGAEFYPHLTTDPATGRPFYAVQTIFQQEVHKSVWSSGRTTFLLGAGAGPSISTSGGTGLSVSVATDVVGTAVVRCTKSLSLVVSVKGQYISNSAGWNLVPRLGFKFDLSKSQ